MSSGPSRRPARLDILLAEDSTGGEPALVSDLLPLGHMVASAPDSGAAIAMVESRAFDLVVIDRTPPTLDGLALVRQLRDSGLTLPILVVSESDRALDKVDCLDAGADDYLVKPFDVLEFAARCNALMRARRLGQPVNDTLRADDIVVSPLRYRAWRDGRPLPLARTEFRLLLELVRQPGGVVAKPALLHAIWGENAAPTSNILEAHIRRLRRKLAEHGDDPIRTLRGVGYTIRG